jgi:lactoylglutathione lyase
MKLPESDDYIEFMLYGEKPSVDRMHTLNHLSLEVPDVAKAEQVLKARTLPPGCKATTELKVGINRKRQINTFDDDGTRVEIMEPNTVDGKVTSSSDAPPPNHP